MFSSMGTHLSFGTIRRLAEVAHKIRCEMSIVNTASIDKASVLAPQWNPSDTMGGFIRMFDDEFETLTMGGQRTGKVAERGQVRFLSMREYLAKDGWQDAFTRQEAEPWLHEA